MISAHLWMGIAFDELGQAEAAGPLHNPRIVEYHGATKMKAMTDEVAWCSAFVCWVMEKAQFVSTRSAAARSWINWGQKLERARYGCIVILKRGTHAWQGHVGFYLDQDATHIYVYGGNQGNRTSVRRYPKDEVIAYRWPNA